MRSKLPSLLCVIALLAGTLSCLLLLPGNAQSKPSASASATKFEAVKDNVALSLALDPVDSRNKTLH
jgi:hypothetical protein